MTERTELSRADTWDFVESAHLAPGTAKLQLLPQSRIRRAKIAFTTRLVEAPAMVALLQGDISPKAGDLVLARVKKIGQHFTLHLPTGRKAKLHCGDEIIVCYGNRYAVDQFEGEIPDTLEECNLLASGGVAGIARSKHFTMSSPTVIEPIGLVADANGRVLNLSRFGLGLCSPRNDSNSLVVAVVGTEMNAGKTTTAVALIKGFAASKMRVAAAKVTGTGSGGDYWEMVDAGASSVLDFTDVGYVSTASLEAGEVEEIFRSLLGHLMASAPEVIVLEIADGLLQRETKALLLSPAFRQHVDSVVFAASDTLGAVGGSDWLRKHGLPVTAISGRVTGSALGADAVRTATGIRVLSKVELSRPELVFQLLPAYDERLAATA